MYTYILGCCTHACGSIIMESYLQVILFVFVSFLTMLSMALLCLIIWYIRSKPPGKTLSCDCVFIDGTYVHAITLFTSYIGILIKILFDHISIDYAIPFAFFHYSFVRCVISSGIVNSILRLLYLNRPAWIIGAPDSQVRKIAWAARFTITG